MDARVILILCLEALFALWLLYKSGNRQGGRAFLFSALILGLAFVLRGLCLNYETLDYKDFLSVWVQHFRDNGGFRALSGSVGNYNIPYLYFLALFSYSSIDDLYLIKLLSIFFDVVLAYASAGLLSKAKASAGACRACFLTVLLLPTVTLNGALWGQCDSTYAAMALLGIYLAMEDRPVLSIACMAVAFGFKLQAVFVLPLLAVLWMQKRFRLWHFFLFPVFYVLLVLPAVALGRPFMETITLYIDQSGSVGSGLNYNSPSVFALFRSVPNEALAAKLGIAAAFAFMLAVLLVCLLRRRTVTNVAVLSAAVLLAVGIPLLLPHMHDRYFYLADALTVVLAYAAPRLFAAPALCQFASLLGYHAYLKMRYLLPMSYGTWALFLILAMTFALLIRELRTPQGKTFRKRP